MRTRSQTPGKSRRGFALVLVVVLLSLLVLVAYALAVLSRIEAQASAAAEHRLVAQRNALASLHLAVGALQSLAGPDDRVTGMAGITGIPAGPRSPGRQWTGVWRGDGEFLGWLVSGADTRPPGGLDEKNSALLVGAGTLGADAADKEHVRAPWIETDGGMSPGRLAWWVADQGVKLSLMSGEGPGGLHQHAIDEVIPGLDPRDPALARIQLYAQLAFVRAGSITPGRLQAGAHIVGVRHRAAAAGSASPLNVNSSSVRYWQGVAATYNRWSPPAERLGVAPTVFGERVGRGFSATAGPGKRAGGSFMDLEAFFGSDLLLGALRNSGVSPREFRDRMQGALTVRSETFLVRGAGEVLNRADPEVVEASAWCEAVVQRTAELVPGHGRRFVMHSFRWLGPEDL